MMWQLSWQPNVNPKVAEGQIIKLKCCCFLGRSQQQQPQQVMVFCNHTEIVICFNVVILSVMLPFIWPISDWQLAWLLSSERSDRFMRHGFSFEGGCRVQFCCAIGFSLIKDSAAEFTLIWPLMQGELQQGAVHKMQLHHVCVSYTCRPRGHECFCYDLADQLQQL